MTTAILLSLAPSSRSAQSICAPGDPAPCNTSQPHGTCAAVGVGYSSNPLAGCYIWHFFDSDPQHAELTNVGYSNPNGGCSGPSVFSASTMASSDFGLLTQSLAGSVIRSPFLHNGTHHAFARTKWRDTLTPAGSSGGCVVRFTFDLAVTAVGGDPNAPPAVKLAAGGISLANAAAASAVYVIEVPGQFGTPFAFEASMLPAYAQGNLPLNTNQCGSIGGSCTFRFELVGVEVTDVKGMTVPQASVAGTSGRVYLEPEFLDTFCLGDGSGATCPCSNTGQPGQGCAHSGGHGASIATTGTTSLAAGDLVLDAIGLPLNKPGLFFAGAQSINATLGDGLLCVVPQYRGTTQFSGPTGSFSFANVGSALMAGPGDAMYVQAFYRDTMGPCGMGTNTTAGVAIHFLP